MPALKTKTIAAEFRLLAKVVLSLYFLPTSWILLYSADFQNTLISCLEGEAMPVSILLCPFQYLYVAVTVLTHLCLIFDAYSRMGQW